MTTETVTRKEPITDETLLEPGRWYAIGFENDDGEIEWWSADLARYEGDGQWTDEDGELVEGFYDRHMGVWCSGADAYLPQS